jgi:trimethylamine corrinoid protein
MMNKPELINEARQTILDADEDKALQIIDTALSEGLDILELVQEGFAAGNREIGELFESGKLSLPELIFSTEVMKKVLEVVESLPGTSRENSAGKVLLATVDGDVHDIGKGMVASTMKSYGIEVIDIGREVPVDTIIEKAKEHDVDIIGTSALLTSTLKEQKKLEERLRELGLRDRFKTMVGGAPCTLRWATRIGADVYSEDAIEAAKKALELLGKKKPREE